MLVQFVFDVPAAAGVFGMFGSKVNVGNLDNDLDAGFAEVLAGVQGLYSPLFISKGWVVVTSIGLDKHTMIFSLETLINNEHDANVVR